MPFDHDLGAGPALQPLDVLLQRRARRFVEVGRVVGEEHVGRAASPRSAGRASSSRRSRPRSAAPACGGVGGGAGGGGGAGVAGGGGVGGWAGAAVGASGFFPHSAGSQRHGHEQHAAATRTANHQLFSSSLERSSSRVRAPRSVRYELGTDPELTVRSSCCQFSRPNGPTARSHRAGRAGSLLVPRLPPVREPLLARRPRPAAIRRSWTAAAAPATTSRCCGSTAAPSASTSRGPGLAYARARGERAVAQASAACLPFGDAAFDLVTSFDVIYALQDDDERAALRRDVPGAEAGRTHGAQRRGDGDAEGQPLRARRRGAPLQPRGRSPIG